ncbi:hypothetical protein ACSSS7_002916 [Eimeria intestinalis]
MGFPSEAEETPDERQQSCAEGGFAQEVLSSFAFSLRSLQSLMEEGDLDEISDAFLRIHKDGSLEQGRRHRRTKQNQQRPSGIPQGGHASEGSMTMYLGAARPSCASTAVPSSSLSLCSASMDCSAAPEPHEHATHTTIAAAGSTSRKQDVCKGSEAAEGSLGDARQVESESGPMCSATAAATQQSQGATASSSSTPRGNSVSSRATTPLKKDVGSSASKEKARGRAKAGGAASAPFHARRSPRLQKTGQGTQQHEPSASPATNKKQKQQASQQQQQQQQQHWGGASAWAASTAAERSRAQMNAGKGNQGTSAAASSAEPKRRREGGGAWGETPTSSRKAARLQQQPQQQGAADERGVVSPAVSLSPLKTNNPIQRKDDAAKTAAAVARARQAAAASAQTGKGEEECLEASDAEDEPLCRFALPVMKPDAAEAACASDAGESDDIHSIARPHNASKGPPGAICCEDACAGGETVAAEVGRTPEAEGRQGEEALHHKVLRALPEPTPQFDFGLFIVRAAALSKHADDIFPLLEDEEQDGVYRPFQDIEEAPWCRGLDTEDDKILPKKEVLRQRIAMQRKWNPFSIFGSSPPSVELEDVFGFEVYQKTAPSARVHHPLFRRLSQFQSFKDLYSSLSRQEWDSVSSAFRRHWSQQCRLDLDWRNDPLTVDEIMWMLEANEQASQSVVLAGLPLFKGFRHVNMRNHESSYLDLCCAMFSAFIVCKRKHVRLLVIQVDDRSSDVYQAEICYCVTPNPNVGFGWNDPRCHRYKAPRPSMGRHILTQPQLVDGFLEDKNDAEGSQEPSTREESSVCDPADSLTPADSLEKLRSGKSGEVLLCSEKQERGAAAAGRHQHVKAGGKPPLSQK